MAAGEPKKKSPPSKQKQTRQRKRHTLRNNKITNDARRPNQKKTLVDSRDPRRPSTDRIDIEGPPLTSPWHFTFIKCVISLFALGFVLMEPVWTGFYPVLLGFTGFYLVLLGFHWDLPSFIQLHCGWLGFLKFDWVWLGWTWLYWVLLRFTAFYWVLLGFT